MNASGKYTGPVLQVVKMKDDRIALLESQGAALVTDPALLPARADFAASVWRWRAIVYRQPVQSVARRSDLPPPDELQAVHKVPLSSQGLLSTLLAASCRSVHWA